MDQRVDNERRTETVSDRAANPAAGATKSRRLWLRERRGLVLLIAVISGVLLLALLLWWLHARQYESTDDAFIDARTVQISPQISAAIIGVPVNDNQVTEQGAVLVRLDDRDFIAQRDQAAASVANFEAQIAAQQAKIEQARKQMTQAEAALTFAQQQDNRYELLAKQGTATVEQAQQYKSSLLQNEAAYAAAQANTVATEKQIPMLEAQLKSAQAQLEQANTNLSRTTIRAPMPGRVTHLTAAEGNYASVGTALMMFVPREVWVTANFKETQLDLMRPGQPVDIAIDTYPDKTFKGHVDSVQSGSGTAFSLLPAENATGNFVKIVQRVPVKIVFDKPPDVLLGPGMSVVPTVKVR
jgi:membrane fusion protein (multidrug efflux system)